MPNSVVQRFIDALAQLESQGDTAPLAALFTETAEIGNVLVPHKFHGPAGARDFWSEYRSGFQGLRSTFRNQILTADRAALEWSTEGTSTAGHPIAYSGVSVLEIEGDRISRFEAYFDPAALGRQMTGASAGAR